MLYEHSRAHTPGPLNTLKSHLSQVDQHTTRVPLCSEVKPRDMATLAKCHQCLVAARHAACTWSRRCRARPNVETLQSCKRTASPGSGKRVRNAEIATSSPRTRLPVCRPPLPRQAAVARLRVRRARTDVGTSQTCAHAARMGAGNTPESPEVEVVGGEGRSG
jgi:hypothetical protein